MNLLLFLFLFADAMNGPWGKDADLVCPPQQKCKTRCNTPLFGKAAESVIWVHQNIISPADGPRSHFKPSSSQYMLDAIRKYGFFRGAPMGCDRLMRENDDPWVYRSTCCQDGLMIKCDPVK